MKIIGHEIQHPEQFLPELSDMITHTEYHTSPCSWDRHDSLQPQTIILTPLLNVPFFGKEDDLVIAALLSRTDPRLHVAASTFSEGFPLWLKPQSQVLCENDFYWRQALEINPELLRTTDNSVATAVIDNVNPITSFDQRPLHPAEMTPVPGHSTIALVCSKHDVETRRILKSLHDVKTGICSNVERKVKRKVSPSVDGLGVLCYQDQHGRYHLYAKALINGRFHPYTALQASWIGLAENCIAHYNTLITS